MAPVSPSYQAVTNPRSALAIVFPIFAALACILYIPPLVLHITSRHFAASVLMISFTVPNIFNFINPLIWPTNFPQDWWNGHGVCDIEIKLQLACAAANVGSVASIFRQLATILNTDQTTLVPSSAQRRRKRVFEIGLCVVVPTYLMIAHYFVQTSRYYIFPVVGCQPSFDNSWVSIVLIFIWPLILCLIATAYGALAAYRLVKYRQQFAVILAASTSSMNKSRFIRLFTLSTSLMLVYLPLSVFTFQQNTSFPRHAYSWKRVHPPHWADLIEIGAGQISWDCDRWIQIGTACLVFPFLCLGQEAKALYRSWWLRINIDRFKRLRTNSSGSNPLVAPGDALNPVAESQHVCKAQRSSVTDISITLNEDEPIKETFATRSLPSLHVPSQSSRILMLSPGQATRKPCEELRWKNRLRQAPTFKIWTDEEPASFVISKPPIASSNQFELTEHVVHQQV
jgi:pheromone a factor receptor